MKGTYLGEFEEIVLLAVGILYDEAYGVSVRAEVERHTGRVISIGAVHTALHRLEEKTFLQSRFGDASDVRGGKRKRLFRITAEGLQTLRDAQALRSQMWSLLPRAVLKTT
jgi:DNA-binding PadR family transcriptional regulator